MPNFSSANEGTWFPFDEANKEAGGICLRELSVEKANEIQKLTVRTKKQVVRGLLVDAPKEDKEMSSRLTWDYCIVDWKNVSLDGTQLEPTSENKHKMMMSSLDFAKFVSDCLTTIVETNKALEEARLKNSVPSSSGS